LDEAAAGVVEHCGSDGPEVGWGVGEVNIRGLGPREIRGRIIDGT
jgi:hypothetical protein